MTRTRLIVVALALLAAVLWWSSQRGSAQAGIDVKVRDFAIKAPKRMAAGEAVLRVTNTGPATHELVLVRVDGKKLPLRPDNLTLDETRLEPRTVDILEDVHPNTVRSWKLQLTPGRYVLLCNMSGHYLGGMHRGLTVR
jgi:uncharacterized cupredoxin-like copper-binding protein